MTVTTSKAPQGRPLVSSYCRRLDHKTCIDVGAVCGCDCHPGGAQMPTPNAPTKHAPTPTPTPIRPGQLRAEPAPSAPSPSKVPLPDGAVWSAPPVRLSPGVKVVSDELRDALRARPGEWARIRTYTYNSGPSGLAKKVKAQLGAGWETKGGKVDDKWWGLWLRYVGTKP